MIDLRHGDCLELMKDIPDGSVDLVVMDPPYNIKKDKNWDSFKRDEYIEFMSMVFKELNRVLADNGQMYFFHNNIPSISDLMQVLRDETGFIFNSFLVFPKGNWRAKSWKNCSKDNNLRSWFNICEYALLYTNGKSLHTEWDKTGWDRVRLDTSNFETLRKYAFDMLCYIGNNLQGGGASRTGVSKLPKTLDTEKQSISSIVTQGRRMVFNSIGGKADHFMRYGSTQWSLPIEETYNELIQRYDLRNWEGFREYEDLRQEYEDLRQEYEDLRQEYEDLRPYHCLDKDHNNVWNVNWTIPNNKRLHSCQKPLPILERMIKCSAKPGAVVLDPFMGSGSTGIACMNTGRDFIGIEKDDHFFEVAKKRIEDHKKELKETAITEGYGNEETLQPAT